MTGAVLRIGAFGLAGLAVVDPALTSMRPSRPIISLVSDGPVTTTLRDEVTRVLSRRFTVVDGVSEGASAVTIIGASVPDELLGVHAPAFAVRPARRRPDLRITSLDVPRTAVPDARIPVVVRVRVAGADGRQVAVDLSIDGARVGGVSAPVRSDSGILTLQSFVMPDEGAHRLGVTARVPGAPADSAVTVIDVRRDRIPVLFFDPRPSWASTFVRRTLEQDARYSVSQRTATSRGVANTSGPAPGGLRDSEALEGFAAIVIGAPDQLSEADVAGVERYMRRRGGRVALLMDGRSTAAIDRLTGATGWRSAQSTAPTAVIDTAGRQVLRGREFFWPAAPPAFATVHAYSVARDSTRRPILWSVPSGAGRLVISGVLDAWQFRDDAGGFEPFWSSFIAGLAFAAPEPVDLSLSSSVLAPGETGTVHIAVRDALLSDQAVREARLQAMLVAGGDSSFLRAWPTQSPGVFTATFVAPDTPGVHRVVVSSGSTTAYVPILVDSFASSARDAEPDVVNAFASSRKGTTVDEAAMNRLPDLIATAVEPVLRVRTWYPMRSAWWIVPFALLLGAEWWLRRRRGLA